MFTALQRWLTSRGYLIRQVNLRHMYLALTLVQMKFHTNRERSGHALQKERKLVCYWLQTNSAVVGLPQIWLVATLTIFDYRMSELTP